MNVYKHFECEIQFNWLQFNSSSFPGNVASSAGNLTEVLAICSTIWKFTGNKVVFPKQIKSNIIFVFMEMLVWNWLLSDRKMLGILFSEWNLIMLWILSHFHVRYKTFARQKKWNPLYSVKLSFITTVRIAFLFNKHVSNSHNKVFLNNKRSYRIIYCIIWLSLFVSYFSLCQTVLCRLNSALSCGKNAIWTLWKYNR